LLCFVHLHSDEAKEKSVALFENYILGVKHTHYSFKKCLSLIFANQDNQKIV